MVHRSTLADYLAELLDVAAIGDYCPNGLQVEGRAEIRRLISGVTASQRFLAAAIEAGADAVLVHHGYFWKGEPAPLTGMKAARVRMLFAHELNLFAYHLPLDVHPQLGNNAWLGRLLGVAAQPPVAAGGTPGLLWHGELPAEETAEALAGRLGDALGRAPLVVGNGPAEIRRIAWCSGGAQGLVTQAAELGVDAYLSGEISEPTAHVAREAGLHYFAAGHHATERGGVQALGAHLAERFGIEHRFIDDDNPA